MNRGEHLLWCKQRAQEYLDQGNVLKAWNSFLSDMRKHNELKNHAGLEVGQQLFQIGGINTVILMGKFIQDFR